MLDHRRVGGLWRRVEHDRQRRDLEHGGAFGGRGEYVPRPVERLDRATFCVKVEVPQPQLLNRLPLIHHNSRRRRVLRRREGVGPPSVPLLAIVGLVLVEKVATGLSPQALQVGLLAAFRLLAHLVIIMMRRQLALL